MRDVFLDNESIFRGFSVREETGLIMTNDISRERIDSTSNDLGDNLVLAISEPNRSKVSEIGSILTF